MEKQSKKPRNNPTRRDPFKKIGLLKITKDRLRMLLEKGFTEEDLADFLGYDKSTIRLWKRNNDFNKLICDGKKVANDQVKISLFKSAIGYTKIDKSYKCVVNEETGKERIVLSKMTVKEMPGNVNAITLWLTNRCRDEWKRNVEFLPNTKPNVTIKMMDPSYSTPTDISS